jgi:multiple sugar transport system permease protein
MRFPGRNALFYLVLGTMMVPAAMTLVPVYIILNKMGWINTYQGCPCLYGVGLWHLSDETVLHVPADRN